MKDGWDQLPEATIMKCFKSCGIFNGMFDATPIPNEHQTAPERQDPDEFDRWFEDLLEVPWDEYLAFDDQLDIECSPRAPTASTTPIEDDDEAEEIVENISTMPVTIDTATDHLKAMQKLFADNDTIFSQNQ